MFIEISPHEGVLSPYLKPLAESYRLNLNVVQKVFFGKTELYEKGDGSISWNNPYPPRMIIEDTDSIPFDPREEWQKYDVRKITLNQITFEVITTEGEITFEETVNGYKGNFYNEEISLYFTKEGEGEYQRIKRIIDENTSR